MLKSRQDYLTICDPFGIADAIKGLHRTKIKVIPIAILARIAYEWIKLGLVAQLVERRLCKAEALGPNPSKSIQVHHSRINLGGKG